MKERTVMKIKELIEQLNLYDENCEVHLITVDMNDIDKLQYGYFTDYVEMSFDDKVIYIYGDAEKFPEY